ncbi:hypothetical protein PpBr36_06947, partial [Pyricularia pennisetigena]
MPGFARRAKRDWAGAPLAPSTPDTAPGPMQKM